MRGIEKAVGTSDYRGRSDSQASGELWKRASQPDHSRDEWSSAVTARRRIIGAHLQQLGHRKSAAGEQRQVRQAAG